MSNVLLFSGNADGVLASRVAEVLGLPLGDVLVSKFKDGETRIQYMEPVQGKDVFLLQSTSAPQDTRLMELLLHNFLFQLYIVEFLRGGIKYGALILKDCPVQNIVKNKSK